MNRICLVVLALMAAAPAHAFLTSYQFDGVVDYAGNAPYTSPYSTISGSFIYDDAAEVIWTYSPDYEVQGNALSNFSLRLDEDAWTAAPAMWVYHDKTTNEISMQDYVVIPQGTNSVDVLGFHWSPTNWAVSVVGYGKEIGGRILNVYKEAYVTPIVNYAEVRISGEGSFNDVPDSAPVPEPASVALMGAGLLAFAALRRRRRFQP